MLAALYPIDFWVCPDWTLLDIRACKKLESLHLSIYVRHKEDLKPQRPLPVSHTAAGLLANYAATTLREISIDVNDLERPKMPENGTVLRLQEFDKVVTQARFPNLQRFELSVSPSEARGREAKCVEARRCLAATLRTLPGLRARGVLKVRVKKW